jgi:hypothetical protein
MIHVGIVSIIAKHTNNGSARNVNRESKKEVAIVRS